MSTMTNRQPDEEAVRPESDAVSPESAVTSPESVATSPKSTADGPESATAKRRKALRKLFWFALSVLAFVLVYFGLEAYMDYGARVTLAITLAVIVLWVLEPIPFSMTAVLVLFLLPISCLALQRLLSFLSLQA
ncbi:hypothetical protein M4D70_06640 [Brevibacillus borstelensis]|uniref:hypothetical protein n=1 Tax=Brevibacillus borstelensis TaxID=45462 RepID=UPI00203C0337|nr:hypothetical protein [Brevibacillus borstelensis]MCM3558787.1 hypothetical protein [Brevibacillus borstelensis]MCM3621938.1 hypothetical protein [Brevibacillus borstelensis]